MLTENQVDERSHDWVHIMKLRSNMPFRLLKPTLLEDSAYAGDVALIIRQEMPFDFLRLPLHIRTKIYKFMLKDDEPGVSVVVKVGPKTTASPFRPLFRRY